MYQNELEIDVIRCLKALYKGKVLILFVAMLFLVIGFAITIDMGEDKYTAKSTVYAAADGSYTESANAVNVMNAYLGVANSYKVCQRAALLIGRNDVEAADIQKVISVSSSAKSSSASSITSFMNSSATILVFYATTSDPQLSMDIADAMAQSYSIEMKNILNNDSVKVLDNAYTYSKTYNANLNAWKERAKYALIGFSIACVVILISEIFDSKVRTIREATIREQLPVLGIIPDYKQ
ncbi:Wzz/FepE/Etk N-terminal domain-containing protein [Butyrivibrio sp. YAB3001]|uniref:Wzz/FepE/Etk N-terminal domain-containing protein n=1 Tax=Butyrivibrio sp. YAB3001 TaxID=1520812 RepID=UPI0008F645E2|nr:Wzz/FepE/Etk N-terminal domain-containing protein [Butyrivibrio sp. YAB3001]SFC62107.1 Capsular polysaccharide biosynthesis protein [Butyrivibrio sp. YAB3001]